MPQRENVASTRRASAFKPPSLTKKVASAERQQKPSHPNPKHLHQDDSSEEVSLSEETDSSSDIVVPSNSQDPPLIIPPKLLTRILHHHFEKDNTRLGQNANALIGKYMETFVREALARAAFERSESSGGQTGGDFLEVSESFTIS